MLTTAQYQTLHADIMADPVLAVLQPSSDAIYAIINAYAAPAAVDYYVWKTSLATQDVFDQITWANFTPTDVPDGTATWTNRSLGCQGKQFNIQTILVGRDAINPAKTNIRAGLQDALTAIPSGVSGASRGGGWNNVLAIMYRKASRLEKLFATGTGTTASPGTMVIEETLEYISVLTMMGW